LVLRQLPHRSADRVVLHDERNRAKHVKLFSRNFSKEADVLPLNYARISST
jgi:hypothetical protein